MSKPIYIVYEDRDRDEAGRIVSAIEEKGFPCYLRAREQNPHNFAAFSAAIRSALMAVILIGEYAGKDLEREIASVSNLHKPMICASLTESKSEKSNKTVFQYYLAAAEILPLSQEGGEQKLLSQIAEMMAKLGNRTNQASSAKPNKPYDGKEPYIFISYSHKDMDKVFPVVRKLQDEGFRVWYDEGIDPATEWDENIAQHISDCGCMIAFISENYVQSNNCKDEINFARDLDKPRLLVYLEETKLPMGMAMRLMRIQAIHAYKYSEKSEFYSKLLSTTVIHMCNSGSH